VGAIPGPFFVEHCKWAISAKFGRALLQKQVRPRQRAKPWVEILFKQAASAARHHDAELSMNGLTASTAVAHCGEVLARTDVASVMPVATLMVVVIPQKRSFVALLIVRVCH
jgi:hypothetical protein